MNWSRGNNLVLVLCAIYSIMAGLYPYELSDGTLHFHSEFPWWFITVFFPPIEQLRVSDFLQNIGYFVPWGVLVYLFLGSPQDRTSSLVLSAVLVGGMVSFAIELCQLFFSRHPSVFDVLANTFGAVLGAMLCAISPMDVRSVARRFLARAEQSRVLWLIVILFGAVPFIVFVSKSPWFDFHNWDRDFTFQLGNEATLDRPWLGTIYRTAIYNRALSPEEVARHYKLGVSQKPLRGHGNKNLIALYMFDEGRGTKVRDVSGYEPRLNLTLSPSSHFRWLRGHNGIEILKPAILKSEGPAEKLVDGVRASNELSIEVWMMPANAEQKGPARIVSLSHDPVARNFTVGQDGLDIDFRLRTPISGANGTAINLRTQNGPVALRKTHLVATYKRGVEKLYFDGRQHPHKVDLKKADFIVAFGTKNNVIAQIAYCFLYFVPVSGFLSFVFSKRFGGLMVTLLLPATMAVSLLSIAELFQAYTFARVVDLPLLGYGVTTAVVGAFTGAAFAKGSLPLRRDSVPLR